MVVDTDDRAGEGSYLTEGDEYRIVYLSLGSEASAEEEKRDTGKRKACCCDQLYELVIVHKGLWVMGYGLRVFLKSDAKVVQKCETAKKSSLASLKNGRFSISVNRIAYI